ncbi:hypothetical protein [Nitrospirillum amazonense]|uniref:hypothetical protein n=1 Tax=Nitrospirillum amazonense TaxID=28077 RepID=UPI0024121A54|nr:hypothetical protein [Nitrospirillum amazonense]MDG3444637.1 hypothetical protein [Nitrospirillum amazonense]
MTHTSTVSFRQQTSIDLTTAEIAETIAAAGPRAVSNLLNALAYEMSEAGIVTTDIHKNLSPAARDFTRGLMAAMSAQS